MHSVHFASMRKAPFFRGTAPIALSLARIALRLHCYDDAEQYYKESLSVAWEAKEIFVLAPSLEGLSAVALAKKSPERAARLLAAAEQLRRSMGVPPVVWERDINEITIRELSAILDRDALETLRAEGRAMSLK